MNAIQFLVLILIGVVCANVSANRQPEGVSKDTKYDKYGKYGVGDQPSVIVYTDANHREYSSSTASDGPRRPRATGYASTSGSTSGTVIADGRDAYASSDSGADGQADSDARASRRGASARGRASGGTSTYARGRTSERGRTHE